MIRVMTIEDYDEVYASVEEDPGIWHPQHRRFQRRRGALSETESYHQCGCCRRTARSSEASFADMTEDGDVSIMYVWMRIIVDMGLDKAMVVACYGSTERRADQ